MNARNNPTKTHIDCEVKKFPPARDALLTNKRPKAEIITINNQRNLSHFDILLQLISVFDHSQRMWIVNV